MVENSVFAHLGRGNWRSCVESFPETLEWCGDPWEIVDKRMIVDVIKEYGSTTSTGKSENVKCGDPTASPKRRTPRK